MIVYITKYWETRGILKAEVETSHFSRMVCGPGIHCWHKPYWYTTLDAAHAHVAKLLAVRIKSAEKKLTRLKSLDPKELPIDDSMVLPK